MALALNAILMFLRHLLLIFTNNNEALGEKQNRVGMMSREKTLNLHLWLKFFLLAMQLLLLLQIFYALDSGKFSCNILQML